MRRSTGHISSLIFTAVLCVASAAVLAADLRSVRRQIDRKEYGEAEREIRDMIPGLRGRDLSRARMMLARLTTEPHEAQRIYSEVIRSSGDRAAFPAKVELAKIYYSMGRYRDLLDVLDEVPSDAGSSERMEAHYFRGLAWKEIGDAESAGDEFGLVDRGDYLYWSYMALAELDIQYGRIEDAVERYETIAGSHSNPIAGFKLGECYEILGRTEDARNAYGNLARLFPRSLEAPQAREKLLVLESTGRSRLSRRDGAGTERNTAEDSRQPALTASSQMYTLQFGAFSVRENAEAFAAELGESIEGLRVESTESRDRIWYRVRVGRYGSREMAEADALRFMEQTGYSSKVLPLD